MNILSNKVDSPDAIRLCLSCPWPQCFNCLGAANYKKYMMRLALEEERAGKENAPCTA